MPLLSYAISESKNVLARVWHAESQFRLAGAHGLPTSASTRTVILPPGVGLAAAVVVVAAAVVAGLPVVAVPPPAVVSAPAPTSAPPPPRGHTNNGNHYGQIKNPNHGNHFGHGNH